MTTTQATTYFNGPISATTTFPLLPPANALETRYEIIISALAGANAHVHLAVNMYGAQIPLFTGPVITTNTNILLIGPRAFPSVSITLTLLGASPSLTLQITTIYTTETT